MIAGPVTLAMPPEFSSILVPDFRSTFIFLLFESKLGVLESVHTVEFAAGNCDSSIFRVSIDRFGGFGPLKGV